MAHRIIHKDASGTVFDAASIEMPPDGFITCAFECKRFDEEKRTADFIASTGCVDAHDEVVDQSSWRLDDYLKNPVVLFAHLSRELPIGQSLDVGVLDMMLQSRILFATADMNPKAENVFQLVKAKFLRTVSVGFLPRSYRYEMRDGEEVWVWADCVLKEISVTPVPANPEALAKMKAIARDLRPARSDSAKRTERDAAPTPTPSGGGPVPATIEPKKESVMTEAEILVLKAAHEKALMSIAELKLEAKNATTDRDTATAKLTSVEAQVKSLTTEKTALEAQTKTLADDRDAQKLRADAAEEKLVDIEVESEIGPGKKILPAEKAEFIELRKTNKPLYERMLAQRSPLKLDAPVLAGVGEEGGQGKSLDPRAAVDDVIAEANTLGAK